MQEQLPQNLKKEENPQRSRLFEYMDGVRTIILIMDTSGAITSINKKGCEILQGESKSIVGKNWFSNFLPQRIRKEVEEKFHQLIEDNSTLEEYENPILTMKGEEKIVEWSNSRVLNNDNKVIGLVCSGRDITARKKIEDDLKKVAEQLVKRNKELEDFADIASHDLQEPLRKIIAYVQKAISEPDSSAESISRYLDKVLQSALRMQNLLDDVLEYSRLDSNSSSNNFSTVDLTTVVEDVLSDLEVKIEDAGAKIMVGELPTIEADAIQMRQLFQNLISNSIKFRKEKETCEIQIYSQLMEEINTAVICIQDNGIGFDEKYVEKIFLPFRRLFSKSKYPGSGIGLAICKKIIDKHCGSISAESKVHEGSTFMFSLPISQGKV